MAISVKQRVVPDTVAPPKRGRYALVDYATQTYLAIAALIAVFFHGDRLPQWPLIVALHAAGILAVHLIVIAHEKWPNNHALALLRMLYPLPLYGLLYRETELLNLLITGGFHDGAFIGLEQRIFGFQPVIRFAEALPSRIFAETFYFAYFSYYFLVVGTALALYIRDRREVEHFLSITSLLFYTSFLTFILVPVLGPTAILIPEYAHQVGIVYTTPPLPASVQAAFFLKVMNFIHPTYQVIGAAFPSSHVAVSLGVAYFTWKYLPRVRWLIAADVFLLALATVYCRYHYAVDVLGGVLIAAVAIPVGEWLYRRLDWRQDKDSIKTPR